MTPLGSAPGAGSVGEEGDSMRNLTQREFADTVDGAWSATMPLPTPKDESDGLTTIPRPWVYSNRYAYRRDRCGATELNKCSFDEIIPFKLLRAVPATVNRTPHASAVDSRRLP